MKGNDEMAALVIAVMGDTQLEVELGEVLGRFRARHEREMRDRQAADLLPLGRGIAAQRLHVAESTVYKMVHRHARRISTVKQQA